MPWIFTYGSLMNPHHFFRILKTNIRGEKAHILGYQRIFSEPGTADIRPSTTSSKVHGIAYLLKPNQFRELDSYEGVPAGYYNRIKVVFHTQKWTQEGFAYQKAYPAPPHRPPPAYLKVIVDGLRYHGYSEALIQQAIGLDENTIV